MPFVSRYAGMTPEEIEASLYEDISASLQRHYSLLPDTRIIRRVREEWNALRSSGTLPDAAALYELTLWLRERGYPFWLCGTCGSSFLFYLLDMTAGNPLPPHYYCPQCRQIRWAEWQADGFDLPENQICHEDGAPLTGDGHGIPWQTLWSGGPQPDCQYEIRLAAPAYKDLKTFLKHHWLREIKPDAKLSEPHANVHVLSRLSLMFVIDPKDVSPEFFTTPVDASCAAAALLESEALIDPDHDGGDNHLPVPDRFADLIYACGLCHSAGTWDGEASLMVQRFGYALSDLIAFRDDVFSYLLAHGFSEASARKGMEQARKGRGFPRITGEMKAARDKWVLARCASVQYLFPKAHAVEWILYQLKALGVQASRAGSYALLRRALSGPGVYLLGGRPGMGKTAFVRYLMEKLSGEEQKRVLVYTGRDFDSLEEQIRSGVDFAIIDPLSQLFRRKRVNAAYASSIMERLRDLSLNTGVPILAAATLTQNPERRRDHCPRISDVPLSDSVLPYTEAVLLLYRDSYYDPEDDQSQARCQLWKYPGSVLRTVWLNWDPEIASFSDGMETPDSP